eukprot:2909699-Amphidinium_carterae.2
MSRTLAAAAERACACVNRTPPTTTHAPPSPHTPHHKPPLTAIDKKLLRHHQYLSTGHRSDCKGPVKMCT